MLRESLAIWLLALIGPAACSERSEPAPIPPTYEGPLVGKALPELTITRWLIDPEPAYRRGQKRPKLILFWNYETPSAGAALEVVQSLKREHPELLIATVHTAIGLEEFQRPERIPEFMAELKIDQPTAIDDNYQSVRACRVSSLPAILFVDREGIIRGMKENLRASRVDGVRDFVNNYLLAK